MQTFCEWMPFLLPTSAENIHWTSSFLQTPEGRDIDTFMVWNSTASN